MLMFYCNLKVTFLTTTKYHTELNKKLEFCNFKYGYINNGQNDWKPVGYEGYLTFLSY